MERPHLNKSIFQVNLFIVVNTSLRTGMVFTELKISVVTIPKVLKPSTLTLFGLINLLPVVDKVL